MLALLGLLLLTVVKANVIGIDLGTEFFKISIIKPGVKLAIVENPHSKRKTPTAVSFNQNERLFGIDAMNMIGKSPNTTLTHMPRLIGLQYNNTDAIQRMEAEFFLYSVEENTEKASISYKVDENTYKNEEIIALLFEYAKQMVDATSEGANLKDCVITVPPFWTRAQRASLIAAATAAKLNVLNLIHENTAAALYYGAERNDEESDHYAIFYNLGASYLQVSLAKYTSAIQSKSKLSTKKIEMIEMLAHAWSKDIGGRSLDAILSKNVLDKNPTVVKTNKNLAKLLKNVNKAKETLSANKETKLVVESILEGGDDLRMTVTREDFEKTWEHLTNLFTDPIDEVLAQAGLTKDKIDTVEIIGGSVRVPKVQELIKSHLGIKDLGWHLNGDEAMANGAALIAANYTSSVQVRSLWLSDISPTSFKAKILSQADPEYSKNPTIFKPNAVLGSKKKLSFSHNEDVIAIVGYSDGIGISVYNISNIATTFKQAEVDLTNSLTFQLDINGIPQLIEAETKATKEETVVSKIKQREKQKEKTRKYVLDFKQMWIELPIVINGTETREITNRLKQFRDEDEQRRAITEIRNDLESYLYFTKDKRTEDMFNSILSIKEKAGLDESVKEIQEWFDATDSIEAYEYNEKLRKLKAQMEVYVEREEAVSSRDEKIGKAYTKLYNLYESMLKMNGTKEWVPQETKDEVFLKLNETIDWLDEKVAEQKELEPWEEDALQIKNLHTRLNTVEKRVEKIEKTGRPKKEKKNPMSDFINIQGGDMSNIKMDNIKIGDKVYNSEDFEDSGDDEDTEVKHDL